MIKINGTIIKEFPISTTNILFKNLAFSGGGYFRLLPYKLIYSLFKENEFVTSYFHIRDFDKEQHRFISLRYFKNYYGIESAYGKFKQLIKDFEFHSIRDVDAAINWSLVPHLNL
jgi:peptidoglycan-N-acetylglucosamine deacetylase